MSDLRGAEADVTTTMRLPPVVGVQRTRSESVSRSDPEPVCAELAARWASTGRTVAALYEPALWPGVQEQGLKAIHGSEP